MFKSILLTLYLAAFFLILGFAGASDHEIEKEDAARYTSMVCQGIWPDYKNSNPSCNN